MKKVNLVSVNQCSHNRDYVKNPQRFQLKVYSWYPDAGRLCDFFDIFHEDYTRCQIFQILKDYFSFGSRVSISKDFFSPFNSDPVYKDFSSNLSYFYDKLPLSKDYLPVALERSCDCIHYFLAIPVKNESKL